MPPRKSRKTTTAVSEERTEQETTARRLRKRQNENKSCGKQSIDDTDSTQTVKISKPNKGILEDVKNKPIRNKLNEYSTQSEVACGTHDRKSAGAGEDDQPTKSDGNVTDKQRKNCSETQQKFNLDNLGTKDREQRSTDEDLPNGLDPFQATILRTGLQPRHKELKINVAKPWADRSRNFIHLYEQLSIGGKCSINLRQSQSSPVLSLISELQLHRVASPFDRRITAFEWHPTRPNILAAASKSGDIILWDTDKVDHDQFVQGRGKAGAHLGMKFWPWDLDKVVTASADGTVTLRDFEGRPEQILANTMDYEHWYCSLDVNASRYLVAAGQSRGLLHLMSIEGRMVFEGRLHKSKITHVEFSPREEWLMCTASVDQTVQLWDVRMLKDRDSSLRVLKHEKPVNSAYFSHTDGCRLLTTDQKNEIRVYQSPSWLLERTILHPHRFFQHITPIKATWHPLQDLIVCGRYPDKNFPGYHVKEVRTIDLIDASTGDIVAQLQDPGAQGISCLNKFSRGGDMLATGMGYHVLLWARKDMTKIKQSLLKYAIKASLAGTQSNANSQHTRPSRDSRSNRPGSRGKGKEKQKQTKDGKRTETMTEETNIKLNVIKKSKK